MKALQFSLVLFAGIMIGGLGLRGYQRWKRSERLENQAMAKQQAEDWEKMKKKPQRAADTLAHRAYNTPMKTEISVEDLSVYLENWDLERKETLYSDFRRYRSGGVVREQVFSFKSRYDPTEQVAEYWFNEWQIVIKEYESVEKAVGGFNKILSAYIQRAKLGAEDQVKFQGDQSRTFLAGNFIYEVWGGCGNDWFVKDAGARLKGWILGGRPLTPRTYITSDCGGWMGIE